MLTENKSIAIVLKSKLDALLKDHTMLENEFIRGLNSLDTFTLSRIRIERDACYLEWLSLAKQYKSLTGHDFNFKFQSLG